MNNQLKAQYSNRVATWLWAEVCIQLQSLPSYELVGQLQDQLRKQIDNRFWNQVKSEFYDQLLKEQE